MRVLKILLLIIFLVPTCIIGQTTIWSEDFSTNSNNDFTGDDNNLPVGADWTTSCGCNRTNTFRVENGEYRVENTDEYAVWTSEIIDISGYTNVSISIDFDMDDNQFDPTDCYHVYYNLDNSGNTSLTVSGTNGNECDDGADPTVASQTGLSGGTLVIRIEAQTTNTNEDMHFDNIVVTGESPLGKDGPGGVGAVDGSETLAFWVDANDLSLSNGNNVSTWTDKSGSSNNATAVTNREPQFRTNILNGFPAVRFTASNTDYLRVSDAAELKPNTVSVFVVGSFTSSSSSYAPFLIKTDNYQDWSEGYGLARTNAAANVMGFVTDWSDNFISSAISYNDPAIMTLIYDKSNVETFYDESSQGTDSYSSNIDNTTNYMYLGISPNGTNGNGTGVQNPIDGDIFEAIVFGQAVNDAQRIIIHNYLAAKYGLTLNANDIYNEDNVLNGNYDYDVAGIGQASDGSSHTDAQGTGMIRMHTPSALNNGDFLIWGHNNGDLNSFGIIDLPLTIQSRLARVWRASETGEVGSTTITVDLSSVAGSITASDLRLLVDANGIFALGASLISGATHLGSNVYQWTGVDIDNNDYFTIGSINVSQTPLPVDLVEFKATPDYDNNVVDLFWVTSSEINNDYFTVEKTKDLVTFNEVVQTTGQGTTNERTEYREVDNNPTEGISYYRLSQTDFDGKTEYFNLEKVLYDLKNHEEDIHVELYPNPNNGHNMYMKIPNTQGEELNLLVNDFLGKSYLVDFTVINEGKYSVIAIEMNQKLSPGVYMINVNVGGENHSHKLVVR